MCPAGAVITSGVFNRLGREVLGSLRLGLALGVVTVEAAAAQVAHCVGPAFGQWRHMVRDQVGFESDLSADVTGEVVSFEDAAAASDGLASSEPVGLFTGLDPCLACVVLAGGKLKALRVTANLLRTHRGSVSKFPGQPHVNRVGREGRRTDVTPLGAAQPEGSGHSPAGSGPVKSEDLCRSQQIGEQVS